jgi:hypothetical protein
MPTVVEIPFMRRPNGATMDIANLDLATKAEDTRRAVSDGGETLGAAAAEFGREAVRLGQEAARLSREAVRRGLLLATSGEKALRRASTDAALTIEDLRSYQIVRKRQGPDWRPGLALIAGASAGLAAMYFLDPEQGRRRRVQLMDQIHKYSRISSERLDSTIRDVRNRSEGLAIEARKAVAQARGETVDYKAEHGVMDTPDVSERLASTDWPEPATPEAVTSDR